MSDELGMPSEHIEICIGVKNRDGRADRDRSDEAVDEATDRLSAVPTPPIHHRRSVEVSRSAVKHLSPTEERAQVPQVTVVTSTGENLHQNRVTDGDVVVQQDVHFVAHGRARPAKELHPR